VSTRKSRRNSWTPRSTANQGKRTEELGESSSGQSVISQQELERYMRMQIEESVYYLFTWTQGTIQLRNRRSSRSQQDSSFINPESLLLEGARRGGRVEPDRKKIPSSDLIFLVDRDRLAISEPKLTEMQDRCYRCSMDR